MDTKEFNKELAELLQRYAKENGQAVKRIDVSWDQRKPLNRSLPASVGLAAISVETALLSSVE